MIAMKALAELLIGEANDLALMGTDEKDPQRRERLCLASGRLHGAALRVEAEINSIASKTRAKAILKWGPDPGQNWPKWVCNQCGQHDVGWTLECGRCGAIRVID